MAMEGRAGKARKTRLMALNEKPRRGAGLDGPGEMALRLNCCKSVSESYSAVLAESNTPTRSPSTWAKSVGEGLSVWDGLGIAYQSPAGLNTVAIRADLGMTSLPSVIRGVGGSFPGFRAVGVKMHKAKADGLRVSRCRKYIKAVTGKKLGKGHSPIQAAYRLLQENGAPRRGTRSINKYLDDCAEQMAKAISAQPEKPKKIAQPEFLETYVWRKKRMEALLKYGPKCMCCGATPKTGAVMNVDHIKPRRTHPELALEIDNLQILCGDCNHGKGNWDSTDWRDK